MAAEDFSRQLDAALPQWVAEGLLQPAQAGAIARRHGLSYAPPAAGRPFSSYLIGGGAFLMGLAALSLVAAHWQEIPEPTRFGSAFVLWGVAVGLQARLAGRGQAPGWASALALLGCLLFGANLALLAQWFQVDGNGWGLWAAWGLGGGALALAQREPWAAWAAAGVWCVGHVLAPQAEHPLMLAFWLGVVVPLLWGLGWRWGAWAAAGAAGLAGAALAEAGGPLPTLGLPLAGLLAMVAIEGEARPGRQPSLVVPVLLLLLWQGLAFQEPWHDLAWGGLGALGLGVRLLALAMVVGALGLAWRAGLRRPELRSLLVGVGASMGACLALLWLQGRLGLGWSMVLANLGALASSLGLAAWAFPRGQRGHFWLGLASFGLLVVLRFLEHTQGLTTKAAVFLVWGLATMALGRWLEARFEVQPPAPGGLEAEAPATPKEASP